MQKSLKLLFLILTSFFTFGNVDFLSADANPTISDLDQSKISQTIIAELATPEIVSAVPTTTTTPLVATATYVPATPENYISVSGKTLAIYETDNTAEDAGDHVNKYGDKFLYGHNSAAVFGVLETLPVGTTFSVTLNNQTKTYIISNKVTFEKNNELLQLNGDGNFMKAVTLARFDGSAYDLSLMTCAGTSYGNGDASHRLVVFANLI